MPIEIGSYVELAELFPNRECSLEYLAECLGALPLNLVLVMCARANQVVSGPGVLTRVDRQKKLANSLLTTKVGERLNEIVRTRHEGDLEKTALFFRGQLLELVRWALLLCDPEMQPLEGPWTQNDKDLFVQAALMCSWISEAKVRTVLRDNGSVESLKDIAMVFFRGALDAALTGADPWRVLGRGQQLFLEYLPKHHPDCDHDFQQATGLSLLEYMTTAGALVAMHLQCENTMVLSDAVTLGQDTEYADAYRAYQDLQIWNIDELTERLWLGRKVPQSFDEIPAFDLKPLREKPIIALDDGRGVIPDPILLADSVMIGPVFHLAAGVRDAKYVFGKFGDAFEEYSGDILERIFPYRAGLHQTLHRNVPAADAQGRKFEIDACLDYLDRLVVVETKGVFMSDASVIACDEASFRELLEKKYLRGERDVAVAQLARAVRAIATGAWTGFGSPGAVRLVYPVLIVHDRLLVEPLVTKLLAEKLVSELEATRIPSSWQWQVDNIRFAPLTILTIDDLEDLECSDGIEFLGLLQAYSSGAPKRKESLHEFMTSSDEFKNRLRINQTLARTGRDFLGNCIRRVFGREPHEEITAD
jgi:hypothetical protein